MTERNETVTFQGNPLTLVGHELKAEDPAPDATLLDNELNEVKLSGHAGGVRVLVAVPSLDTSVCDAEARRFNEEAGKLGGDVKVLVISMDLPFAQARWCGAAGMTLRSSAVRRRSVRCSWRAWPGGRGRGAGWLALCGGGAAPRCLPCSPFVMAR